MEKTVLEYSKRYKSNLMNDVIPFWMNNSVDKEYGGFFTCLDRQGGVYDTDKFIWLQCRQVWCFAMLYNKIEQRKEWLDLAIYGAEFLLKNGRDAEGNWYFSLDRKGDALVQPYNIFSDCFATMAFGQLSIATGNAEYGKVATDTFFNIIKRQNNPKGKYDKVVAGTRPIQSFSLPMILSNLVLEVEALLSPELIEETINNAVHSVMDVFYKPSLGLILENLDSNGGILDSFEGRLVNPGHGLEAMWFIMDLAQRKSDNVLTQRAVDIAIDILDFGWDKEHGGIFYFKDVKGFPPQQLEWDQKLWWVHVEALVCMLKGYLYTGDERCWEWFEKLHTYTWKHFPDPEFGEWFGYLNREGKVLLNLKGGKWKGCFHVPRGLYQCYNTLELIAEKKKIETLQH